MSGIDDVGGGNANYANLIQQYQQKTGQTRDASSPVESSASEETSASSAIAESNVAPARGADTVSIASAGTSPASLNIIGALQNVAADPNSSFSGTVKSLLTSLGQPVADSAGSAGSIPTPDRSEEAVQANQHFLVSLFITSNP